MKACIYCEAYNLVKKSGIGKAFTHQVSALSKNNVEITHDLNDDYDLLHINTTLINSIFAIRKARKKNAKVIYHAHSTMEDFKNSFIFSNLIAKVVKKILINFYSRADAIITPTPYSKWVLQSYGIKKPITALSNGIDNDKFTHSPEKAKAFRKHFSLSNTDKVVVSAGLWIERKGILDFIEVAKHMPDVTFIWFGQTALYSIPAKIRRAVTKHNLPNVIFPGYLSGDVFEGAFTGADAFFFPSYEETEGIVILEALSSSQKAIVRDIPVYHPWLSNEVNCFKGNDNDEFVKLIRKVINSDLSEIANNAHKTACNRSIDIIGHKLKEIYSIVLNDKQSTHHYFNQVKDDYFDKNFKPL